MDERRPHADAHKAPGHCRELQPAGNSHKLILYLNNIEPYLNIGPLWPLTTKDMVYKGAIVSHFCTH